MNRSLRALLLVSGLTLTVWPLAAGQAQDAGQVEALALVNAPKVCGPAGGDEPGAPVSQMVRVDGFGTGGFAVDTVNPEAQAWFDHGVQLRWAFDTPSPYGLSSVRG